jgi:hypothetical protein
MNYLIQTAPQSNISINSTCYEGQTELVSSLIHCGANINNVTRGLSPYPIVGKSPFIIACKLGSLKMVRLLINHGADYKQVKMKHSLVRIDMVPTIADGFLSACIANHVDIVYYLMARGLTPYLNKGLFSAKYPSTHKDELYNRAILSKDSIVQLIVSSLTRVDYDNDVQEILKDTPSPLYKDLMAIVNGYLTWTEEICPQCK